ncbi:hypothetical protein RYX36_022121, partial [Vicia faba]
MFLTRQTMMATMTNGVGFYLRSHLKFNKALRLSQKRFGDLVRGKWNYSRSHCQNCNRKNVEEAIQGLNGTVIGKQTVRLSWGRNPGNKHECEKTIDGFISFTTFIYEKLLKLSGCKLRKIPNSNDVNQEKYAAKILDFLSSKRTGKSERDSWNTFLLQSK